MAQAVAQGARAAGASKVDIKRVPDLAPDEPVRRAAGTANPPAAIAQPGDLANYDAILFGTPSRFGGMSGSMRHFLDQCEALWLSGALVGKLGSVFTASAMQQGGHESTLLGFHPTLLQLGMIVVGLPRSEQTPLGLDSIEGGAPYGAFTVAGAPDERMPSEQELAMARDQGRHVATIAGKLFS